MYVYVCVCMCMYVVYMCMYAYISLHIRTFYRRIRLQSGYLDRGL